MDEEYGAQTIATVLIDLHTSRKPAMPKPPSRLKLLYWHILWILGGCHVRY